MTHSFPLQLAVLTLAMAALCVGATLALAEWEPADLSVWVQP